MDQIQWLRKPARCSPRPVSSMKSLQVGLHSCCVARGCIWPACSPALRKNNGAVRRAQLGNIYIISNRSGAVLLLSYMLCSGVLDIREDIDTCWWVMDGDGDNYQVPSWGSKSICSHDPKHLDGCQSIHPPGSGTDVDVHKNCQSANLWCRSSFHLCPPLLPDMTNGTGIYRYVHWLKRCYVGRCRCSPSQLANSCLFCGETNPSQQKDPM